MFAYSGNSDKYEGGEFEGAGFLPPQTKELTDDQTQEDPDLACGYPVYITSRSVRRAYLCGMTITVDHFSLVFGIDD